MAAFKNTDYVFIQSNSLIKSTFILLLLPPHIIYLYFADAFCHFANKPIWW